MYDPIMRVLTVLEILQAKEHVSGAELAERLEVSSRTVQRYIARLQDLCIPVEASRGVGGSYRLRPGFRLPPLMFTDEEAFALTLGSSSTASFGSCGVCASHRRCSLQAGTGFALNEGEARFTTGRVVLKEEDGGTVMRCGRERLEMLAAMLLSFGCRIVVRHPPELLAVFSDLARLATVASQNHSEN